MNYSTASIHGRFQPFHNGHLQYFNWAKNKADKIYIGITQIHNQHSGEFPGADHRGTLENNPLSYFERSLLIEATLLKAGYDLKDFRIIPFPIEDPFRLTLFLPTEVTCFTTIHSDWNQHKIDLLEKAGYRVEVLSQDEDKILRKNGSQIRELIRRNDKNWLNFVPAGARDEIENRYLDRFQFETD